MPRNGEINTSFGVYKNLCCGMEIIIPAGVIFPDCATHIHLITEWKNIHSSRIPHVSELAEGKKTEPAA